MCRAVKTGGPACLGPALTGFGLYRAGSKSPVDKTGLKYTTRARPYTGRGLNGCTVIPDKREMDWQVYLNHT
ncbi:hypothetical protein MTR_5g033660 [Medicago truncatula]|uniref:Uncharacterized protein n=1 Tax=Medicago truncatula TaxID=3880 RepID=G7K054_MEDTR|nr:hypothetical protein MTR_5g033660 [Medicago truncatula]